MVSVAGEVSDPGRLAGIRSDLPIYLFSGDADPIAGGGALVRTVADRYRAAGLSDVTVELYPGVPRDPQRDQPRRGVTHLVAWLDRVTAT